MTGLAKSFNQIHITTRRVIQMTFITKQAGLLRSARSWGVLGLLLAFAVVMIGVSSGYGQRPAGPLAAVTLANQQLRTQVASALSSAAEAARVRIAPDDYVFASRDDVIVINARRADLDKVGSRELSQGAVLGLILLTKPDGSAVAKDIPAGFYTVKATVTETPGAQPKAVVQLVDQQGKVVSERLANVGKPSARIKLTVEIGEGEICIDIHWGWRSIEACGYL
jgi:hypothetical protein